MPSDDDSCANNAAGHHWHNKGPLLLTQPPQALFICCHCGTERMVMFSSEPPDVPPCGPHAPPPDSAFFVGADVGSEAS